MELRAPKIFILTSLSIAASVLLFFSYNEESEFEEPPEPNASEVSAIQIEQASKRILNATALSNVEEVSTEVLALARKRREEMKKLLETNPQRALDLAFSYSEFASLPQPLKQLAEKPFSETVNARVIAVCGSDPHYKEEFLSIESASGKRYRIEASTTSRFTISKRNAPIQGIELDGEIAVHDEALQILVPHDVNWALQHFPLANHDSNSDFLSDRPLGESPTYAVSGGYLFAFSDQQSFDKLAESLRTADAKPGLDNGSPQLLAALTSERATAFSTELFSLSSSEAQATETRQVLIIRADFPDLTGAPTSKIDLESIVNNSVAPALASYSYYKTTVQATATDAVYRLPNSSDSYRIIANEQETIDSLSLYEDAIAAYINSGNPNPETQYDHVSINFPKLNDQWAGLASIGGLEQWLQGKPTADTILHELGHNYGLHHATYWTYDHSNPSSTNPVDPTGSEENYGDIFDVMGNGTLDRGHFHMAAKQYLGWIENDEWQALNTPEDSGSFRIYNFDSATISGLQALRIQKTSADGYYWIGYRNAYSGIQHLEKGAYLIWQKPGDGFANNKSKLIDTTPGSVAGKEDAGLALGRTYSDLEAQVHITPTLAGRNDSGAYLDVTVNIGDFSGNQAPMGTLTAATTGQARTATSFSFDGSDPDGDTLAYYWDFGDGTVELSQASIEHSFPVGGTYTLTLTVSDMKGGTFTQQATVEVSDPISNYTTRTSPVSSNLYALAANDSYVVAVGQSGAVIRSSDGVIWTEESFPGFSLNLHVRDLIRAGDLFYAAGMNYDNSLDGWVGVVYTSANGADWSELYRTSDIVDNFGFTNIAVDPITGAIVAVRNDTKLEVRDSEGNWSTVEIGKDVSVWRGRLDSASVVWTGSSFILGGIDTTIPASEGPLVLLRSEDGLNWTDISAESGLEDWYGLDDLAYINDTLLGSGFKTHIRYSTDDGLTWHSNGSDSVYIADAYAYGNGIYSVYGAIDVSLENQVETGAEDIPQNFLSTDARNWSAAGAPPEGVTYHDRIFFNNTFISVGDSGLIHQSDTFEAPEVNPYESMIEEYFTDTEKQAAQANPDGDWASNFLEFALGSDPSNATSIPNSPVLEIDSDQRISVTISRFEATEAQLDLEISTDLENWTPLDTVVEIDTETILRLKSVSPLSNTSSFFIRIRAGL